MQITVKLVSMGGSRESGDTVHTVDDQFVLGSVPALVDLEHEESLAMLVNNMPVPPENRPVHTLSDGDVVTVFPPIKGG